MPTDRGVRSLRSGARASPRTSAHDLHVASGRVLDRLDLAAARNTRRHLRAIVRREPVEPVRPPGARMLDRFGQPALEIGAGGPGPGPILVLVPLRRVYDARDAAES